MSLVRSITPISKDGTVEILMRTSDKGFGKTAIAEIGSDAEPKPGPKGPRKATGGPVPGLIAMGRCPTALIPGS